MKTQISGTTMPLLLIGLEANDRVVAEPGEFRRMTETVREQPSTCSGHPKRLPAVC